MKKIFPFTPKIRYELLSCALRGHFLVGTNARTLRDDDAVFAREYDGLRFYRCLRCNTWIAQKPPRHPTREFAPDKHTIEPPIRGRLLRDRFVLRLIAVDRAVHVLILLLIAAAIFLFASHQTGLRDVYFQILHAFQGVNGSLTFSHELVKFQGIFEFNQIHIYEVGALVIVFACIEAIEMIGLRRGRRWAEYLTFVATILFIPYEIYELIHGASVVKVGALIINLAIALYLLWAKRLFGLNGGTRHEKREEREDTGWAYLERTSPAPRRR